MKTCHLIKGSTKFCSSKCSVLGPRCRCYVLHRTESGDRSDFTLVPGPHIPINN